MIPDTHVHLDLIKDETGMVVSAAQACGVSPVITVGINLSSSAEAVRLSGENASVYAAVGVHPNDTAGVTPGDFERLEETARSSDRVVAIGETGLDYYRNRSSSVVQKEAFRAHIRLAKKLGLTLIVHDREAHGEVLEILAEEKADETRVIMHCFSGDKAMLEECARRGYFISFAGPITFKNSAMTREIASLAPPDKLLVETDSPFLSPVPYRGKPNLPERARLVAEELARVRALSIEEMAVILNANTSRAFNIEDTGAENG